VPPLPPEDSGGADDLYEAYQRYSLRLQDLREHRHQALIRELEKDRSHGEFIEHLRAERGQRLLMSKAEFASWWSRLAPERQERMRDLYSRPVEETVAEAQAAVAEAFERRLTNSRDTDG
jgi:hypothetical protein